LKTLSGRRRRINSLRDPAKSAALSNAQSFRYLGRLKLTPISSRASQNAAALLFDPGTVDIR
jgi:hypothetical protein